MLKVLKDNKEIITSYNSIICKKDNFTCPFCGEKLIFVNSILKIKHFRHKVESNCENEPETEEHIKMKLFMMKKLNLKEHNLEVNLKFAIADLYLFNEKIAIEVQYSPISLEKFIDRNRNYSDNGISVLWVFHKKLLKENIHAFLRKAHELYFGRIYVYHNNEIYPIHFLRFGRDLIDSKGYLYFKNYKLKRKMIYGNKICSFHLVKSINSFRGNNFKVAKFYDSCFWRSNK